MPIQNRPNRLLRVTSTLALALFATAPAFAEDQPIPLRAEDVLELLQNEGVISKEQAAKVRNIARQRLTNENQAPVDYTTETSKDTPPPAEPGVTRVPYIPQYLKDEIRDELSVKIKDSVVDEVMAHAWAEDWGASSPDAWARHIRFNGDIRFRYHADRFADGNSAQYRDFNAINAAGGTAKAGLNAFINTTEDRDRLRLRFRLGMEADVANGVTAGMRIATGNPRDPVSTNQTLGGYGGRYDLSLDRAYLRFSSRSDNIEATFGRMPNPWMSTELIWDDDLNFDGAAFSYYFNRSGDDADERRFDPFVTLGAFPLQEVELSSKDKWLFGAQTGFAYRSVNSSVFKIGLSYYHYANISGVRNAPDSTLMDYTAPPRVQKGNTMFDISNSTTDPQQERWALAADYREAALSVIYDIASLSPVHVILSADYVKNIGFDKDKMQARAGASVDEKTTGYDFGIHAGAPKIKQSGDWNIGLNYRYLERDAVLDAFTDSDFHLGGTDAQGYKLAMLYGIADNTWLRLSLISSNEIDGPPLGVTTVLTDLNARF